MLSALLAFDARPRVRAKAPKGAHIQDFASRSAAKSAGLPVQAPYGNKRALRSGYAALAGPALRAARVVYLHTGFAVLCTSTLGTLTMNY